jgi:hypothetical protein
MLLRSPREVSVMADPHLVIWRQVHWPTPLDAELAHGLLERLASDVLRDPIIWEARSFEGAVVFFVGTAAHQIRALMDLLEGHVPGATQVQLETDRRVLDKTARLRLGNSALPLSSGSPAQSARALLAALSAAHFRGEQAVLQVTLGRSIPRTLLPPRPYDPTQSWFDALVVGSRTAAPEVAARMRSKQESPGFAAAVRIGSAAPSDGRRVSILRGLASALRTLQAPGLRVEFLREAAEELGSATVPRRLPLQLSSREVLALLGWPIGGDQLPGLPPAHPRLLHAPRNLDKTRVFATTTAPGEKHPVGISANDSLFHALFLGPSGVGKSTGLLNLIVADMRAGRSVVVIDPKADLIRDVLARVPVGRHRDVVVLDPTSDHAVGLNPIRSDGTSPELIADGILTIFRDLFPTSFGPNVADALHASLLTLAHSPGATLAWLPRVFSDGPFRARIVGGLNPALGLEAFWAHFDSMSDRQQAVFVGPVLSRLRQLLLRPSLHRVLDQPEPKFLLADLLIKPRILLVPLNSGLVGTDAARLLGSLLVTQLWQLTLARAAVSPEHRPLVSFYVDEVQEYLRLGGSELSDALSRSRSLGVAWHLAHQFRSQLKPELRGAVDANVRSRIIFTLDSDDARELAQRAPGLDKEDFSSLGKYAVYANLMAHGEQTGWFSAATLAAPAVSSDPVELMAESQRRYGVEPASPASSRSTSPGAEPPPEPPTEAPIRRRARRTE